jgi:hypothetical protein
VPAHERFKDALDIAWIARLKALGGAGKVSTKDAVADFWCNIGQSIQRRPFGPPRCLTTSSLFYNYAHDFVMDGLDCLKVQGHPSFLCPGLSGSNMLTLAGEGFSIPAVTVFLNAIYLNPWGRWWHVGTAD